VPAFLEDYLMKSRNLAAAACVFACTATASFAATIKVDGNNYSLSPVTGTFSVYQDLLQNQLWYGNLNSSAAIAYYF
jgi:hypothetical protein